MNGQTQDTEDIRNDGSGANSSRQTLGALALDYGEIGQTLRSFLGARTVAQLSADELEQDLLTALLGINPRVLGCTADCISVATRPAGESGRHAAAELLELLGGKSPTVLAALTVSALRHDQEHFFINDCCLASMNALEPRHGALVAYFTTFSRELGLVQTALERLNDVAPGMARCRASELYLSGWRERSIREYARVFLSFCHPDFDIAALSSVLIADTPRALEKRLSHLPLESLPVDIQNCIREGEMLMGEGTREERLSGYSWLRENEPVLAESLLAASMLQQDSMWSPIASALLRQHSPKTWLLVERLF